jgi:hypothetical protein
MSTSGIVGLHLIRFGTAADQNYFLGEFAETYDQIVVNANIVAHMPSAMATFLAVRAKKPFFIDPQTVAFQHEIDHLLSNSKKSAGEVKRSWKRIVEYYGDPVRRVLDPSSPRSILPEDFQDNSECRGFCARVVQFQNNQLSEEFKTGEDADYVKYVAEQEGVNELVAPTLIVAPYFFLNATFFDEWLSVNLRCLEFTRAELQERKNGKPLAAQLVISKEVLLTESFRAKLVDAYRNTGAKPEIFLLWIDSFTEQQLSLSELRTYVDFVKQLASTGAVVVNLYGGYFSVAAARFGELQKQLVAVCHGLEYGESKPVVPISGGVPVAKFYLPVLHSRLAARVAVRAIAALGGFKSVSAFHNEVCSCPTCKTKITTDPVTQFQAFTDTKVSAFWRSGKRVAMEFPTAEAADFCAQHYMWCKHREYTEVTSLADVCASLNTAFARLTKHVGLDFVGHAAVWPKVLQTSG